MATTLTVTLVWFLVSFLVVGLFGLGSMVGYHRGLVDGLKAGRVERGRVWQDRRRATGTGWRPRPDGRSGDPALSARTVR